MNDQTDKLIRDLAEKLGTTAEHLWGILIKQAPISASTKLATLILLIVGIAMLFKVCILSVKKAKDGGYDGEQAWAFCAALCIVLVICCSACACNILSSFDLIIAGFLNPEYWAFKQIKP